MTDQPLMAGFLKSSCEETVIYRYLEMLAERTASLEQQVGRGELIALRTENKLLKRQIANSDPPSLEHLTAFLPILFRNFWGAVGPDELARLAGSKTAPEVPSPYPEPNGAFIVFMKNRLLGLPQRERHQIIEFARQLPHRLDVRPEMRDLLGNN